MNINLTEVKNLIEKKVSIKKQISFLSQDLTKTDTKLMLLMWTLVPEEIQNIVESESILATLVAFDTISCKLCLADYQIKTKKSAEEIVEKLLTAWDGLVELDGQIDMQEPHRISYKLKMKTIFE